MAAIYCYLNELIELKLELVKENMFLVKSKLTRHASFVLRVVSFQCSSEVL